MRNVDYKKIVGAVKNMVIEANYNLSPQVSGKLKKSLKTEKSRLAKATLKICLKNLEIAKKEKLALCQDTGLAVFFIKVGQDLHIKGGILSNAVNEGVKLGYKQGYLRKSVVSDPLFERKNTLTNTPAIIHTEIVKGNKLEIVFTAKGGGAENTSSIKMFKPTDTKDEIADFIVDTVKKAGANACPPVVVGVGIGGSFEHCAYLAKKALIRPLGKSNADKKYAKLEREILDGLNKLNIGPQGFGGKTTALAVHIEHFPCHIASLPVAINLNCWVHRIVKKII